MVTNRQTRNSGNWNNLKMRGRRLIRGPTLDTERKVIIGTSITKLAIQHQYPETKATTLSRARISPYCIETSTFPLSRRGPIRWISHRETSTFRFKSSNWWLRIGKVCNMLILCNNCPILIQIAKFRILTNWNWARHPSKHWISNSNNIRLHLRRMSICRSMEMYLIQAMKTFSTS